MESMTVEALLTELEHARESLEKAVACVSPALQITAAHEKQELVAPDSQKTIVKVVTENGFVIERVCEREVSIIDSARECHFVVRGPDNKERCVTVTFGPAAVRLVQSLRSTGPISLTSPFWLRFAENHLATYLWKENDYPPAGYLTLDQLSQENLLQAITLAVASRRPQE
jgi:hypothetical protein